MNVVPSPRGFFDKFDAVSGWSNPHGQAGTITNPAAGSGKVLDWRQSANGSYFLTATGKTAQNGRIMQRVRQSTDTAPRPFGIACRVQGTSSNRQGIIFRIGSANVLGFFLASSTNTYTNLGTIPFTHEMLTWFNMDMMFFGNKFFGSAWRAGEPRPEGWMVSVTDDTLLGAGGYGVHTQNTGDNFQLDLYSTTLP